MSMFRDLKISWLNLVILCLLIQSCGSLQPKRTPAAVGPEKCAELVSAIVNPRTPSTDVMETHMARLVQENIVTDQKLNELLEDPIYKAFIFDQESPEKLREAALIVELLRKQNPEWPPSSITQRYKLLFNTCGI
jgi:hypothetical protein